jgi:large subunit ribosomal protein L6
MSRLGKKPVEVPSGVDVKIAGQDVTVKGPKGTLTFRVPATSTVEFDAGSREIRVARQGDFKQALANHGLTRSLLANMVEGVSKGYERRLMIHGTGYNCKVDGKKLHLNIGFMGRNRGKGSQFELPIPAGLEVIIESPAARGDADPAKFLIKGIDKQQVGQFAAEVRALRKTEPYKGKGIRYEGETVRRKQGKALTGGG